MIIKPIVNYLLNTFLYSEKDSIQKRFDRFDERLDSVEKDTAVNAASLSGLSLSFFSHIEALEASINGVRTSQEAMNMVSGIQYKFLEETLSELKAVIRVCAK